MKPQVPYFKVLLVGMCQCVVSTFNHAVLICVDAHLLLLITIKRGTICMSQRPIKCKNVNVSGFDSKLYDTHIQHKNLNIHKHSLSSKGIQHRAINIQ